MKKTRSEQIVYMAWALSDLLKVMLEILAIHRKVFNTLSSDCR